MAWLKKLSRNLDTFMPSQLQQFHPVVERLITSYLVIFLSVS